MKHLLLALLLVSLSASSALADTPAKIAEDFRKASASALAKVNGMLEKATTPLIASLITRGDSAGAELLTKQLKTKLEGEPVPKPHASATLLFAQYDQAREKALEPVKKASIARIDSLLKAASTPSLETVTELGKVRAEVEAGKAVDAKAIPVEWTYRSSPTGPPMCNVFFEPNGTARKEERGETMTGTWRMGKKGVLNVTWPKYSWVVTLKEDYAELVGLETPLRYLVPVKK